MAMIITVMCSASPGAISLGFTGVITTSIGVNVERIHLLELELAPRPSGKMSR